MRHGDALTPAFMRPQLITWKSKRVLDGGFALGSWFGRVSGLSLGMCAKDEDIVTHAAAFGGVPFHLHVFPREVPEDGLFEAEWARLDAKRDALFATMQAAGIALQETGARPQIGDWVMDVIVGQGDEEPMFIGAHRKTTQSHVMPGGLPRFTIPKEAPSRAYLKLEQALAWGGLDNERTLLGKTALELGCAPGGASYALLRRGVRVIGIDPGQMDPMVLRFTGPNQARMKHLPISVGDLGEEPLPRQIDLLISDMNLAPPSALRYIEWVQSRVHARIFVLTLKINDRAIERAIPSFLQQLGKFAPGELRVTQLPANRREICVVACV